MNGPVVHSAVPTFLVADVAATVQWYLTQLGFRPVGLFPAQPPFAYASLMFGKAEIMLLALEGYVKPPLPRPRPTGHWDAYFRVEGAERLYEAMREEPVISSPLKQQRYGDWEFEVTDPNGYVLVFGGSK